MSVKLKQKVLVTGANGHLGYNVVKQLIEKGYSVRAGIRNSNNISKAKPLLDLGAEVVELDILNKEEVKEALNKVHSVIHTAAVYSYTLPSKKILGPTVDGLMNILKEAKEQHINKIIYISSLVTMGSGTPEHPINENSWGDKDKIPYHMAKTIAEKQAWTYVNENNLQLISLCPGMILGPNFSHLTPSLEFINDVIYGKLSGIPPMQFNVVDVRDVAKLSILALENSTAEGRYLATTKPRSAEEIINAINNIKPIKIPKRKVSNNMFIFYAYVVKTIAAITFKKPSITPIQAKHYTKTSLFTDNSKTVKEFNWVPIPFTDTLIETIKHL